MPAMRFTNQSAANPESISHLNDLYLTDEEALLRIPDKGMAATIDAINATGYGLTMGLHSRIDSRARDIAERSGGGNICIDRKLSLDSD